MPDELIRAANVAIKRVEDRASAMEAALRKYQWVLIALGAVLLMLAGAFFWLWSVANDAHQLSVSNCEAGNSYRHGDETGWDHVLDISTPKHATPQQLQAIAALRDYFHQLDAPRDCSGV